MINSNRRIIKLFESVPKFDTYSQYSISLEKIFHENSLKHLIKNLKEEKKPKIYSYFNTEEKKVESNRYNHFKNRISKKRENSKNNLLYDEDNNNNIKEKENPNQINISESYQNINKRIKYKPDSDPFRYNPNYNSILKKIPYVKIITPSKTNNKRPTTFLTEIGDIAVSSNNLFSLKRKNSHLNSGKYNNLQSLKIMKEIYNKKKKLSLDLNKLKNNHSIRFDKYSGRKEIQIEKNPNVSYIEPYDYQKNINNSTDFKKMLSRINIKTINKERLGGPAIGYYNPNYEYFEDKVRNISLGNEHTNKRDKKFLLKKLWGSYNVRMEYLLVDNNKLNNENSHENKNKVYKYTPVYTEPNKVL